jgi:hypothetical protein
MGLHQRLAPVALVLLFVGLVGFPSHSLAAAPKISEIQPQGARRGVATEVSISGSDLAGNPRLIAPFAFKIESAAAGQSATSWKPRLTIAPDVAIGAYPIRVQTDDGISNAFLFVVGQLPQVSEKEDNSVFEAAQPIPDPPLVVEGQIAGNDVDFFRFRGKKGQQIVIDAQCARIGSALDPSIRLTKASANRTYIASADDSPGLVTDARLVAVLPEDSDYVVEIADSRYQGASRPGYRLLIGNLPVAEEVYPLGGRKGETLGLELRGGSLAGTKIAAACVRALPGTEIFPPRFTTAMIDGMRAGEPNYDVESLSPLVASSYPELREPADLSDHPVRAVAPVVFNGRLDPAVDEDRFSVVVTPGERLRTTVRAAELGSNLDAVVEVLGKGGSVLANADDTTIPQPPRNNQQTPPIVLPDPSFDMTIPGGTTEITLVIRDLERRGGVGFPYRIVVEPLLPDFELVLGEPQVSVPRGGTAAVAVTVLRKGYTGPITLSVADPPAGLSVRPGSVAAGQTSGVITVSASADAAFPAAPIKLVGRGQRTEGPFERLASELLVFTPTATPPAGTITQYGLVAAPALATPVALDAPAQPIEVPHGYSAKIPVKVARSKGADGALAISGLFLPAGVTVANATIAAKALDGSVTVNAPLEAALGTMTIALHAKGKFGGAERSIALPAVTLSVVHPVAVELAGAGVEVKPGSTVELKGKLVRKGAFDGPVTVRINGLPAGVKADPVTLSGAATAFAVKVAAEPKAAPTSANTQVALLFQVNKKDYPVPTTPLAVKVAPIK